VLLVALTEKPETWREDAWQDTAARTHQAHTHPPSATANTRSAGHFAVSMLSRWRRRCALALTLIVHLSGALLLSLPAPIESLTRVPTVQLETSVMVSLLDYAPPAVAAPPAPPMIEPERATELTPPIPARRPLLRDQLPPLVAITAPVVVLQATDPQPVTVANRAAAAPPIETRKPRTAAELPTPAAPVAAAPQPASRTLTAREQKRADRARRSYVGEVMAHLLKHRFYPPQARKDKLQGIVKVRFSIDSNGNVLAATVATGASLGVLDQAALDVLRRASPLPPIPKDMQRSQLSITVPIEFSLTTE
jgi:protein TonB